MHAKYYQLCVREKISVLQIICLQEHLYKHDITWFICDKILYSYMYMSKFTNNSNIKFIDIASWFIGV